MKITKYPFLLRNSENHILKKSDMKKNEVCCVSYSKIIFNLMSNLNTKDGLHTAGEVTDDNEKSLSSG